MKFTVISFLLFSQLFTFSYEVHSEKELNETAVRHTIRHILNGSLALEDETKIGLVDPSGSGHMNYYSCTADVLVDARSILLDRPKGSEVYILFVDNTVWELKLCHEHNRKVIECGDELNE